MDFPIGRDLADDLIPGRLREDVHRDCGAHDKLFIVVSLFGKASADTGCLLWAADSSARSLGRCPFAVSVLQLLAEPQGGAYDPDDEQRDKPGGDRALPVHLTSAASCGGR